MKQILSDFKYIRLEHNGVYYVMYASREVSGKQFLNYCTNKEIELNYFRDISTSIKKFFLEEHIDNLNLKQQINLSS